MLTRLLVEHDQLAKTLNYLEMHFMELCRGGKPDYSLMHSLLEYIHEYPEQIHHPLEDKVFSILNERVDESELIQELIEEHEELENRTRKLRESLRLLEGNALSSDDLIKQLSEFLIRQRQHMYLEEQKIHPLIERFITEEDWIHVQSTTPLYKGK